MVSEKLKTFFSKLKDRLNYKDIAKFASKEAAGAIPVVGSIIKDAISQFSPDEQKDLIKELKELSESQFREISRKAEISIEYLKDIQQFTLYTLKALRADHEEIKELVRSLAKELKPPEVSIPTILSVLKKGKTTRGDFFKKDPEWIDFEEGFIVERKEVNESIKKLKNNSIQLLLGQPASGKSIALKNLGFKLAKKGHAVYAIELKKWPESRVESFFKEALRIDDEKTLIIVDDAHLQLSKCEGLIRDFRYKKSKTKLIIGTREVKELKGTPKRKSEFEGLAVTRMSPVGVADKMIHTFLKKKHGIGDEYQIKTVSKDLAEYKHDLWNLSWALKAYNKDTNKVRKQDIYTSVCDACITYIEVPEQKTIVGQDVLLPLSFFYRFEIPVEKRFLTKTLQIDEGRIDDLASVSEIREIKEKGRRTMLSLHHSSLALLYYEIYRSPDFPELGERVKERIIERSKNDDLEQGLFQLYLKSEPMNSLDVLIHLGRDWQSKKEGPTLQKKLIEDRQVQGSIERSIEKEDEIEKITRFVARIAKVNEEVALELVDALSLKIEKEEDIFKIGLCVRWIAKASKEITLKLASRININALSLKIEKEEDIGKIGRCVSRIARARKEIALKLASRIDINALSLKIEKEKDIFEIGSCVSHIAEARKEIALKLASRIDIDALSLKIEKEEDMEKIGSCVSHIADVSEEVGLKLVDALSLKIEKEEDMEEIGWFVSEIADASKEVGLKLASRIDIDALSLKIEKEKEIEKIGWFVSNIADANKEVALKLLSRIDINALLLKIEKEEDIFRIQWCVDNIAEVSKEVAQQIVSSSLKGRRLFRRRK